MDAQRVEAIKKWVEELRFSPGLMEKWVGVRLQEDIDCGGLEEYEYIEEYMEAVRETEILWEPISDLLLRYPPDSDFPDPAERDEEDEEEEEDYDYYIPCPNCDRDFSASRLPGLVKDGTWRTALCPECNQLFEYRGTGDYVMVVRKP